MKFLGGPPLIFIRPQKLLGATIANRRNVG